MNTRRIASFLVLTLLAAGCLSGESQEPTPLPESGEATSAPVLEASAEPASTEAVPATVLEPSAEPVSAPVELDCQTSDAASLDWVACNVIAALETQNTQALLGYMSDPFGLLYWRSEGISASREDALAEIESSRLPADVNTPPEFSTDAATLPSMADVAPASWLGPDVNLELTLFSTGWGPDGQDEAMLFFTRDAEDNLRWSHLFYALGGFER